MTHRIPEESCTARYLGQVCTHDPTPSSSFCHTPPPPPAGLLQTPLVSIIHHPPGVMSFVTWYLDIVSIYNQSWWTCTCTSGHDPLAHFLPHLPITRASSLSSSLILSLSLFSHSSPPIFITLAPLFLSHSSPLPLTTSLFCSFSLRFSLSPIIHHSPPCLLFFLRSLSLSLFLSLSISLSLSHSHPLILHHSCSFSRSLFLSLPLSLAPSFSHSLFLSLPLSPTPCLPFSLPRYIAVCMLINIVFTIHNVSHLM